MAAVLDRGICAVGRCRYCAVSVDHRGHLVLDAAVRHTGGRQRAQSELFAGCGDKIIVILRDRQHVIVLIEVRLIGDTIERIHQIDLYLQIHLLQRKSVGLAGVVRIVVEAELYRVQDVCEQIMLRSITHYMRVIQPQRDGISGADPILGVIPVRIPVQHIRRHLGEIVRLGAACKLRGTADQRAGDGHGDGHRIVGGMTSCPGLVVLMRQHIRRHRQMEAAENVFQGDAHITGLDTTRQLEGHLDGRSAVCGIHIAGGIG